MACGSLSEQPLITSNAAVGGNTFTELAQLPHSRENAKLIATYGGLYSDADIERAVARAVGRLVAASDDPSHSYRVTILNSPAVNAFALPSGDLFVTRGLLALANDESELAAVIAHEMAHVTAQHASERQRRAQAVAVASRVLGNMVNDPLAARAARQNTELSLARFSQAQELEADTISVRTLAGAGFDPNAAARFLRSLGAFAALPVASAGRTSRQDFLSSHPTTPQRIAVAATVAKRYGAPVSGAADETDYLSSLDGLLFGDDPREGFVRGRDYLHADLGIAFTVPEGYALRNTADAVLATDGDRTAIRFDGVALPPDLPLDEYLNSGWVNGLVRDSVRSETINGLEAASASAIVEGWSFRIGVVRAGSRVYRFIFASSAPASRFESAFRSTFESFHRLMRAERANLKPLRLRIVAVRPGDTVASLAARMEGTDPRYRRALFLALNGLDEDQRLVRGERVKIVTE